MAFRSLGVLGVALLVAGCFSGPKPDEEVDPWADGILTVRERHLIEFNTKHFWSTTLEEGLHKILPVEEADVAFTIPAGKGPPSATVNLGVFRPDVPAGTKVPVIADVGPYYYDLDGPATEPAHRLGQFLIDNLVPHGFAVAQVSVPGTGKSGGCMDLMGKVEQAGIHAAMQWLASQSWSNGNIGLIGRSYDGSTVWEAALQPGTPVTTVVPISGLYGQYDLMWRNGSAETRGPGLLWGIYYTFTYTPAEHAEVPVPARDPLTDRPLQEFVPAPGYAPEFVQRGGENAMCPETQQGAAQAAAAYANGSPPSASDPYWTDRSFRDEVLSEYKGSVYFIHGLQDWNVDPHMAFPFYSQLAAKGLDMKGLFGQWGHMYPDRFHEHKNLTKGNGKEAYPESVRYDWAQDLLEWFNYYLKGEGHRPELHVEVQDAQGKWRLEETYPPRNVTWEAFGLGTDLAGDPANPDVLAPGTFPTVTDSNPQVPGTTMRFESKAVEEDLRIAGLAQFHVTVTPQGPGGQIYAELRDATADIRLAHAIMDLRYADGGTTPKSVTPGQPLVAKMEFFAADVLVPKGHKLELVLANSGRDYLASAVSDPVGIDQTGKSRLRVPVIERGEESYFQPPTK